MPNNFIQVYEHQSLKVDDEGKNSKGKDWKFEEKTFESLKKYRGGKEKFKFFELINKGVKFKQYVGVLQVGNVTIEVLPKIDKASENNKTVDLEKSNSEKSKWQNVLIGMIKTVNAFDVKHSENANLNVKHNTILELYFEMFIVEVERLLHLGLIKKYRKTEGNLGALKGKLKFSKHISKNIVHKEKFYVEYTTYDVDHILHRIIYKTIKLLRKINNNAKLDSKIGSLLLNFPELKDIKADETTFEKITYTRKTESYRLAISISKMLLLNYHPDISNGRRDVLALMFDMNVLWEKFVLKTLRKTLDGYEIKGQSRKDFWQGTRNTLLKPDLVITKKSDDKSDDKSNNNTIIIDTKWKQAKNPKDLPGSSDLHQLFAYAIYWKSTKVALLYPGESSKEVEGKYLMNNTKCNLLFAGGPKKSVTEPEKRDDDINLMKENIKCVVSKFLEISEKECN